MHILVKIPSRGRPDKLLALARQLKETAEDNSKVHYLFTLDKDDATLTPFVLEQLASIGEVVLGMSKSKIDACNRDMLVDSKRAREFDILCLLSDDMFPCTVHWDAILRQLMTAFYPDLDGVLFFNDGYQKRRVNTISIMGKAYYDRFGYIYHPDYRSFFCDEEFTVVADQLLKQTYFEQPLFWHLHWMNIGGAEDETYKQNNPYFEEDKLRFHYRKLAGFPH